ncbi:uncharacterized protein I303_100288 [Kwoniella dejecticola CBS 10117]|uniref:WSC domain-containing protein n=1 Tax=Kwoniella dejecticola CBS 10117 TaxID=1296121 RepID=A0A1A6AEH2_9TREE|nr:uncharacterized protein I303_00288 [Kwoniella dejecticola CBS 10117]OBR88471.1 hypothetical protein I303_00288 [Kwoniella dejecticola CBS 10117]
MFTKYLLLLSALPYLNAVPLPLPLLGLSTLPVLDSVLTPLSHGNGLPDVPSAPLAPAGILPDNGGLIDTLLDTVETITGPLNISAQANIDVLGVDANIGLNVELDDNEEMICGPVIGYWSARQYNIPCACWSDSRGLVISAQLELDLGLDQVDREGLDTFLQAQIQFGGKGFTYPAYSMPTCDGNGGFTCPGGFSSNGKCTKFLAARPRPKVLLQPSAPGAAPSSGASANTVPSATDLLINSIPPTTLASVPTASSSATGTSTAVVPLATVASPDGIQGQGQGQPIAQAQEVDEPISIDDVVLTTSTSTSTIVLPATVFVEMITTTQPTTIWATQTQTQTQTVTSTIIQTQWATQTQYATTTVHNCAADEGINVNSVSVSQSVQQAGFTPSNTPSVSASASPSTSASPSQLSSTSIAAQSASTGTPTSEPNVNSQPASSGNPGNGGNNGNNNNSSNNGNGNGNGNDDDDTFRPGGVINLSHPPLRCSHGEEFKSTMCCRVDQVEINGECRCAEGFENILNLNVCLSICLGDRLPSGECSSLGLNTHLDLGLGDV